MHTTIDHGILLECLVEVGEKAILQWFWSFLWDKSKKVVLEDYCSISCPLAYGFS